MANTYSISLEGSRESLHKQVVLRHSEKQGRGGGKKVVTQHYQNAKQIRASFNKWGFSSEKPEDNRFLRQKRTFKGEV